MAFCAGTTVWAVLLALWSHRFGYDRDVQDMPCLALAGFLVASGAVYALVVPQLVRDACARTGNAHSFFLAAVFVSGTLARVAMFASEPILENDYQRYLWDGAVTASGHNPYAHSPGAVIAAGAEDELGSLAVQAGDTLRRIGHKGLTTIYPPAAQLAFAAAHRLAPWNLDAWRALLLAADVAAFGLIVFLLRETGRPLAWVALYWLNPVAIKEGFNSAHMEPLLAAAVLSAVALAARRRAVPATAALAIAAGIKLWPVLLAPILWHRGLRDPKRLALAALGLAFLLALVAAPLLLSGSAGTQGLVAYAADWKTNSALYPALEAVVASAFSLLGLSSAAVPFVLKSVIATGLGGFALWLGLRSSFDSSRILTSCALVAAALVLLAPAQYPWYMLWFAPFLPFLPLRAFLVLTATLPLYYASFHFAARDTPEVFSDYVVWLIWLPAWIALWFDGKAARARSLAVHSEG